MMRRTTHNFTDESLSVEMPDYERDGAENVQDAVDEEAEILFKDVQRERHIYKRKHYLLKLLIFLLLCGAVFALMNSGYFSVKKIVVEGNLYYTDEEVIGISKAKMGTNLFFHAGIKNLKKNLLQDPYFVSVQTKRKLPSTLVIQVKERRQTAAVVYGEDFIVIDREGMVLRKTKVDPEIPLLTGLTISRMDAGKKIAVQEQEALKHTLDMLDVMKDGDVYFRSVEVGKVALHCYIYDNLLVKGSPQEIKKAIKDGTLQKVITNLFSRGISRGTIKPGGDEIFSFSPQIETE